MRLRNLCLAAAAAVALAGCGDDPLSVTNLDDPDIARTFSTPDGIEAVLRTSFAQVLGATHGATDALWVQAAVRSFESYGSVANFGMNVLAAMPRTAVDNSRGNQTAVGNFRDFAQLSMRGRQVANGIQALDSLVGRGLTLGSPAQNARARAFGFFTLGLANGELSLMYDSVGVSTHLMSADSVPPLVGYAEGMSLALAQLDSAVVNAAAWTTGDLPADWLRMRDAPTTRAEFLQIVRSTKARLRAAAARTPAERDAVNWQAVLDDAAAGITSDITLDLDANAGWGVPWLNQLAVYSGWHQMPLMVIGMADTSGAYRAWLGQPLGTRTQFNIRTPDRRFPPDSLGVATAARVREEQQDNSPGATAELPRIYFMNRDEGDDTPGDAWANSPYDFVRFRHYRTRTPATTGPWHWMAKTEIDMLRAEALMRLGRDAEAVPLINLTREANGLAPFPAGSNRDTPAPGGNACVPQVPTAPTYEQTTCGSMFEAMKWEKRLETLMTGYAQWFLDARGWGDLAEGTAYMWPVPYEEMDARRKAAYNGLWQASLGTYGFGR